MAILQDLRFAARMLRRSPGFAAVAVATLALGIGANTAVFSVVNAVVLRPLHFPNADRLVVVLSANREGKSFPSAQGVVEDWRDRARSFEILAGARFTGMIWSGPDQAERTAVGRTTSDFFDVTGFRPIRGRIFAQESDALVSEGFWRRALGGDPAVIGRTLLLDGSLYTICGVLPEGLRIGDSRLTEVWLPLTSHRDFRSGGDVLAVGRLKPGVTREAAQGEMDAVMAQIRKEHVEDSQTYVSVQGLQDWTVHEVRVTFFVLLGAVGFVLLIGCANIANLLLARATGRQREMAIRAALGATRARLAGQSLVESGLLSLVGGAFGVMVAAAIVRAVPAIQSFYIPRAAEIGVDRTMLLAAAAAAIGSAILFGLAPLYQTSGRGNGVRNALVVAQLALALVLLSGAGLMTNTLLRLLHVDLGFERDHVVTAATSLPYRKYDTTHGVAFQRRLAEEVRRMPGVKQVSASDHVPLEAVLFPYRLQGTLGKGDAMARDVDPNYFAVIGIPLLAGRDFQPGDDTRTPIPVLINRTTATMLFGETNPIGRPITTNYSKRRDLEVIGVVGDSHQLGLTRDAGAQLYLPFPYGTPTYVVARTSANAGDLSGAIRAAVRAIDREVPPPTVSSMDERVSKAVAKPRFYLAVLGSFAGAGLLLAAIGIYGVMAYSVARRTKEFGIRMALGADRANIFRLVLGSGGRLIAIGAALGLAGSLAASRLLSSLLYGVTATDPTTFAEVVAVLGLVAIAACSVAARKATGTDPNEALRAE